MEKELEEKVEKGLQKAEGKLKAARKLFEDGFYEDSVSRSYYSMFHATSILLMLKGIEPRSHSGLVQMFGLHLVKTGEIDKKFGKMLAQIRELREDSDYEVLFEASKEEAELSLQNAEEFLQETRRYLKIKEP